MEVLIIDNYMRSTLQKLDTDKLGKVQSFAKNEKLSRTELADTRSIANDFLGLGLKSQEDYYNDLLTKFSNGEIEDISNAKTYEQYLNE